MSVSLNMCIWPKFSIYIMLKVCLYNLIGLVSIDTAGIASLMELNNNLMSHGVTVRFHHASFHSAPLLLNFFSYIISLEDWY